MKKIFVLSIILLLSFTALFACGGSDKLNLSVESVTLEAYDDYHITLPDGETNVSWSSSDESIATVTNGLVSCYGKVGDVTITAQSGKKQGTVSVHVVDSDLPARIVAEEQTAFVNGLTDISAKVRYNDNLYDNYTVSTITIADTSIACVSDGRIYGIREGETTVDFTVNWKGNIVRTRSSVALTVLSEYSIITDSDEYDVYNVNESSTIKTSSKTIGVEFWVRGVKVDNPNVNLTVKTGASFVSVNGLTVSANPVDSDKTAVITVTAMSGSSLASCDITVNVHPNFVQKNNREFITGSTTAVYEDAGTTVAGVSGAYIYYTDASCVGTGDWVKWGHQLELQSLKTVSNESKYDYIINELGYTLVAFDIYYVGQTNGSGVTEYRGVSVNAQYGINSSDSMYYVDCVKNVAERKLIVNGKLTNKIVPNTWTTVVVDFRAFEKDSWLDTYVHSSRIGDTSYITNIRYYYDDEILKNLDESGVDSQPRILTQDSDNSQKYLAQANEFMNYSPVFTNFVVKNGDEVYYSYSMNESPYAANEKLLLDAKQQRKIYPYNIYKGVAVKTGLKYIAFDYRLKDGNPILFVYDKLQHTNVAVRLSGAINQRNVLVYSEGKNVNTINENEWVSILVVIDTNLYSNDTIYITATEMGSSFNIKNIRYYMDDSGKYELGYNDLLSVRVEDIDYGVVDKEINIKDVIFAQYKGLPVEDYVISDFVIDDTDIATLTNNILTCKAVGSAVITFNITYTDGAYSQTESCNIYLTIFDKNVILFAQNELVVYCGDDEAFVEYKTVEIIIDRIIIDGVIIESQENITTSVYEGVGIVSVNGLMVTGLSVGDAVVQVSYANGSKVVSAFINVLSHDGKVGCEWILGSENSDIEISRQSYGGKDDVEKISIASSADIWDNVNKLFVKETDHVGGTYSSPAEAGKNMKDKGYNYVAFDFCLPNGSGFYVCAPNGKVHSMILIIANQAIAPRGANEPFKYFVYDENGVKLSDGAVISGNTWYTIVIKYDYDSSGGQWSCVQINLNNVNSSVYINGLQCWFKNYLDLPMISAPPTILGNREIPAKASLPIKVYYLDEEITDAVITVKVADASVATYTNGKVTFLKSEETTITITAEWRGMTVKKTVKVLPYVMQETDDAWSLFADPEQNSFENGVLTLSTNVWNDYIVLKECDGRRGTNPDLTTSANAISHMKESGYETIVFTVRVLSGTTKVYAPVSGNGQGYIGISATSFIESSTEVADYISLYDSNGNKLSTSDTLVSGTEYIVVIKYNTENTGWGEIAIKGATTSVELGDVYFYSE